MSDAAGDNAPAQAGTDAQGGGRRAPSVDLGKLVRNLSNTEVMVPVGLVVILVIMILPMPSWLLDFALTGSFTLSVLILMQTLFIRKSTELSAFPVMLLVATLIRLALNVASTKLILGKGHEGTDAAGQVIQSFGMFLMSGNVVLGIIAFAILVIINLMVVTKGATRVAEVAARFTLDGMPGKQMAIDADMSAGLIDEEQARQRREELQQEATFFGAMDGASKFVRGDAMAGILITLINIVGGIVIGVVMNDLSFGEATSRYTILTVGDGLVTQIPAIMISIAAGILVTKAGVDGHTDQALVQQLSNYPKGVAIASGMILALGLLPGLPFVPFVTLGGGLAYGAWVIHKRTQTQEAETVAAEAAQALEPAAPKEEPITTALALDQVRLELGYGLLPLINEEQGFRLTDQIKALRRQLASDYGFVMPSVRILDNMNLDPNTYLLKIKEAVVGDGQVKPGMLLVMDPTGQQVALPGETTTEPAFGLPATWVDGTMREEANFRGYTAVDAATVVTTHLTEIVKDNMPELLSYAETQKLLDDLPREHQKLVEDMIPTTVTVAGVQRVLQTLLGERVSIRDLPTILEGIAEATSFTNSAVMMAEHVRARLARQISHDNAGPQGFIPLLMLSPQWEQAFAENLTGPGEDKQLSMPPSKVQEFIGAVRQAFDNAANQGESPALLTSPGVRPYVRSIVERFRPATVVLSQAEIHPKAKIRTLGQV
ncbi:flagellar biosynthesis protein FlhA [Rhodothalassium salexigens DSM 2132]|uniref:Flagellar biosynthesis protein FlhA n=1 Tax=Rhodothalassium salexigens DSM 2132 TaxID=1188247 RepID=A0A4R2PJQ6_RHOSA|nr:flagellar biosynthesis protein FlhA [Rhodothalassium salexigens]MBB4211627.1 flagellar biosynthesis protein FlhA [Rhodothalassium salexigens DSM 2132]MBK1639091.1 flagellar biosynthesis protein FlhA [Rhodothalassium salexigens DSM 2132]TCP34441.1 flagellar biosynthesis protein FlhA [Rhodothalassium salexigens DSM 2132]